MDIQVTTGLRDIDITIIYTMEQVIRIRMRHDHKQESINSKTKVTERHQHPFHSMKWWCTNLSETPLNQMRNQVHRWKITQEKQLLSKLLNRKNIENIRKLSYKILQ